ncbi:MAG TPA: sucrase ferredoxin [Actinomycetota bacterium]|nr:sucrase ferredoxin [Actinomycetota bacterium]
MTDRDTRCADASEARAEPLYGTASHVTRWVLLEQPGSWGRDALSESGLRAATAVELKARALAVGARVVLIRRGVRFTSDRRQCYVARTEAAETYLARLSLDAPEDLLDIDLAPLVDGGEIAGAERVAEPVYLVCTHGKHDACCSIRGNQVSRVACAQEGSDAWESAHIGGDRFAANVVCFPHGVYYGRVTPDEVTRLMEMYRGGVLSLDHYRGRSCFPFTVQAADYFVRRETGRARVADVAFAGTSIVAEGVREARFELDDGTEAVVSVRVGRSEEAHVLTCSADAPSAIPRFELVSLRIGV